MGEAFVTVDGPLLGDLDGVIYGDGASALMGCVDDIIYSAKFRLEDGIVL